MLRFYIIYIFNLAPLPLNPGYATVCRTTSMAAEDRLDVYLQPSTPATVPAHLNLNLRKPTTQQPKN